MKLVSLDGLLLDQLKDLYSAESQLTKALPKMAKRATDPALKEAFHSHLDETRGQLERLKRIGEGLGKRLSGKVCKAMQGLIEEGSEVLEAEGTPALIDAALIGAAQRVEHYEISAYGTARTFAERLGNDDAVRLLQETLDEESAADKKLTVISEGLILMEAAAVTASSPVSSQDGPSGSNGSMPRGRGRSASGTPKTAGRASGTRSGKRA